MHFFKKIKEYIKATPLWIQYKYRKEIRKKNTENNRILKNWKKNGMPVPPPLIFKQLVIKEYANKYNTSIFIETGTYFGDTLDYCKNIFNKLISIELDAILYKNAKNKFADENKIVIYPGDSGQVIKNILSAISEPCLFWLDGHYSEGITAKGELNTPILNELKHIFDHPIKDHVILIDDARCFTGNNDYPTISTLRSIIKEHDPGLQFSVDADIIRVHR